MKLIALILLLPALAFATTYNSDGTVSDFNTKYASASNGDTITIAAGSFSWASGSSTITKQVTITGGGAGRIVARSSSSVAVGTGTKTWTLITESVASIEALKSALTNGTTVRIAETCSESNYMQGTVTSLSGTTLTMNITSTGGSGTPTLWVVQTLATTTITHNAGASSIFTLSESTAGSISLSGIRFIYGTGTGLCLSHSAASGGVPILVHDNYFDIGTAGGISFIRTSANRGVIWNCSFTASTVFVQSNYICLQQKDANATDVSALNSWLTASTMGTNDTGGVNNLYMEDCDLHGFAEGADSDDNGRVVIRYCLLDNSGMGTHGADTSFYGIRHYEYYRNEFAFVDRGASTFNLSHWLYFRGGTGVVTENIMPNISSGFWGDKPEIRTQVQQLQRNAGPSAGWGVINTSGRSGGWAYPAPRQLGFGRVTGSQVFSAWASGGPYPGPGATWFGNYATFGGATYKSTVANTSASNPSVNTSQWTNTGYATGFDSVTYIGDSEPLYVWNNTPSGGALPVFSIEDYGADNTSSVSTSATPITCDTSANYIVLGRDYFMNRSGTSTGAKPSYTEYTYPQPLRTGGGGSTTGGSSLGGKITINGNAIIR